MRSRTQDSTVNEGNNRLIEENVRVFNRWEGKIITGIYD
jgi:hypothetical protein